MDRADRVGVAVLGRDSEALKVFAAEGGVGGDDADRGPLADAVLGLETVVR
jgi:hypothetical protein